MKTLPPPSSRRAFTFVEILLVSAIVLLLAAILFPVFGKARDSARTATCASNLRQMGMGLRLYLSDSNGFYPKGLVGGDVTCAWPHNLVSYTKNTSVFNCPSDSDYYVDTCLPDKSENNVNYTFDGGYVLNFPNNRLTNRFNDRLIRAPAQMILVLDGHNSIGITAPRAGSGSLLPSDLPKMSADLRHNDALNALFADGHVKRESSSQLLDRAMWTMDGTDVQPTRPSSVLPTPTPRP